MAVLLFIVVGGIVLAWVIAQGMKKRIAAEVAAQYGDAATSAPTTTPPDLDLERVEWQPSIYEEWAPEEDLLIVGESFHTETFLRLAGGDRTVNGDREGRAFIVAEPENKYDPNAVGVWVPEGQLGYIPRDDAAAWQSVALALRERGKVLTVPCWIGWGPGPEHGDGVWCGSARLRWSVEPPTIDEFDLSGE